MTSDAAAFVDAPGVDATIPWHYGDPLREQRVLATGAGLVDRSNRDVVRVGGDERLSWLHKICSQHLSDLADGDAREALVLSPRGHVEQHWQVTELGGAVWIDSEPGAASTVLAYLESMRFFARVDLADVSSQWAVFSLVGPRTSAVLADAGLPVPEQARAEALPNGGFVRRAAWPGPDAVDLIVARADVEALTERLRRSGAEPAGSWAFAAMRVQARRPRLGFETDHRTIPHEVGWIGSAVHLNKGCYRGQETVARVHNLGSPPRRLVLLHLAGESDDLPTPGAQLTLDGRAVGFMGTAVHHYELGPVALGVVKRSIPAGATLLLDGAPVTVED